MRPFWGSRSAAAQPQRRAEPRPSAPRKGLPSLLVRGLPSLVVRNRHTGSSRRVLTVERRSCDKVDRTWQRAAGMPSLEPHFSQGEELAHALTHGFGLLLALLWTVLLVGHASQHGDTLHVLAVLLFGITLIILYAASTFCHALPDGWRSQQIFEQLDFTGIYALIAGTYTPFMVGPLRGPWGWSILSVVWLIAVIGIVLELMTHPRNVKRSLTIYLAMGWLGLVAGFPLSAQIPLGGLLLLLAGGASYTVGVLFYAWRSFRYHHAVWHLFVLLGSALHVYAAFEYAIPSPG